MIAVYFQKDYSEIDPYKIVSGEDADMYSEVVFIPEEKLKEIKRIEKEYDDMQDYIERAIYWPQCTHTHDVGFCLKSRDKDEQAQEKKSEGKTKAVR